jgi:chromosome partitioning protein
MTRTLAYVNQKGGVCKTTLAAQTAYGLARLGKKVLGIDLDPQGNLTFSLGLKPDKIQRDATVGAVLEKRELVGIYNTPISYLDVIPADIGLARLERSLSGLADWQFCLQFALKDAAAERYDYILLDCPPNLGLLTINGLMAAQEVVIPVTCDSYALKGMVDLWETIRTVQKMNASLGILGVIATRVNLQRNIDKDMLKLLKERFPTLLFSTRIPENTALKVAGGLGKSIWEHDAGSLAIPALEALCEEIVNREVNRVQPA